MAEASDPVGRPPALPDGWTVDIVTSGPMFAAAETLEYEVFRASGFAEPSDTGRTSELEAWRSTSSFHVVIDANGVPAGVVRSLVGPFDELPVAQLEGITEPPPDPVCEYATLAIRRECRQTGVAEALYPSVWKHARRTPATGLVAIVEPWLHSLLSNHYALGFSPISPPQFFMGGTVIAISAPFGVLEHRLPSERPLLWEYFIQGVPTAELARWGLSGL